MPGFGPGWVFAFHHLSIRPFFSPRSNAADALSLRNPSTLAPETLGGSKF